MTSIVRESMGPLVNRFKKGNPSLVMDFDIASLCYLVRAMYTCHKVIPLISLSKAHVYTLRCGSAGFPRGLFFLSVSCRSRTALLSVFGHTS